MAKKQKVKKTKVTDVRQAYLDLMACKMNEAKGMYLGAENTPDAINSVANLYNKGMEIEVRIKEAEINLAKAIVGGIGMGVEIGMHERDMNTCLGLEQAYHSGAVELKNLRKDFKPRRLLEK